VLHRPVELAVYCSKTYATLCRKLGVTQSMGAVGSPADNALAESFNATLKREVLQHRAAWADEPTCRREAFGWLVRYNTRRRHSWCRYQTPIAHETAATTPPPLRSRQRRNPTPCPKTGGKAPRWWPTESPHPSLGFNGWWVGVLLSLGLVSSGRSRRR